MQKPLVTRQDFVDAVLQSDSRKKIVVAGPGTGKTFLFKEVLKGKKKTLTLTFINSLVEDLSLELQGISEVRTLHGFARAMLKELAKTEIRIFPKLEKIISEDASALLGQPQSFNKLFHTRDDENELVKFYSVRRRYYDKYFGYSDVVYALVLYLEKYPDKVPVYDQVVVDEFQDFNKLEVDLIELLATKSPVLIVGDDDQALYDFKHASAEHIRHRYSDDNAEYASFTLPYCSRCTSAIVAAANDVIAEAKSKGYLQGRVPKDFKYHSDPSKDSESEKYPTIGYKHAYAKQIPWFIQTQIEKLAQELRETFSVLVICPTSGQCARVADGLRKRGFENVDYVPRSDDDVRTLDGLKILLEDKKSNLGWRIAASGFLDPAGLVECIKRSHQDPSLLFLELVGDEVRGKVEHLLGSLRDMTEGHEPNLQTLTELLEGTALEPRVLASNALREELNMQRRGVNAGIRRIPISVTTIQSSKGLAKDFVFICFFDDQYFLTAGNATDRDLCNYLVATTRARRRLYLVSSRPEEPLFLGWIKSEHLQRL